MTPTVSRCGGCGAWIHRSHKRCATCGTRHTRSAPLHPDAMTAAVEQPCCYCHAPAGTWCYTPTGRRATTLHSARWDAAWGSGALPLGGTK